jgi:FkbM family methyltransferase
MEASMKRKLEYVLRSVVPPAARELQRALHVARRTGGARRPVTLLKSYHSSRLDLLPVGYEFDSGLVVDVGANVGAWSGAVLELAPRARIIAVEPSPEPFERCRERFAHLPNVEMVNKAVGATEGHGSLYRTESSHNTSLHRPRQTSEEALGWGWGLVDEMTVDVLPLDALVPPGWVSLLKIDVQGGERNVLEGGGGSSRPDGSHSDRSHHSLALRR